MLHCHHILCAMPDQLEGRSSTSMKDLDEGKQALSPRLPWGGGGGRGKGRGRGRGQTSKLELVRVADLGAVRVSRQDGFDVSASRLELVERQVEAGPQDPNQLHHRHPPHFHEPVTLQPYSQFCHSITWTLTSCTTAHPPPPTSINLLPCSHIPILVTLNHLDMQAISFCPKSVLSFQVAFRAFFLRPSTACCVACLFGKSLTGFCCQDQSQGKFVMIGSG